MLSPAILLLLQAALTTAAPALLPANDYAPVSTTCPARQLVRRADGISSAEAAYIAQRYSKATQALALWLESVDEDFKVPRPQSGNGQQGRKAPVIALTSSGGGYRAQLTGGGVVKGLDGRELPKTGVSGVYQALTYHAGLSGGSWLLSSIAGNDYPTVSSLQANLWGPALQNSLLVPPVLLSAGARPAYLAVAADIQAKVATGYAASIIDPWGRLLSYQLLYGSDGGVRDTMSGIASTSTFAAYNGPYPIITALGSDININGQCVPQPNATQYEFHPYEFGSWDTGVNAFVVSDYLGTTFSAGKPTGQCVTHYDQLGYVLGTSSNVFAGTCAGIPTNMSAAASLSQNLAYLTAPGAPGISKDATFALYPNPFQNFVASPHVASQKVLDLVDGGVGVASQGDPIWPMLHRDTDVIIVSANSANTAGNYPDGTEIRHTYEAAAGAGLKRMPFIPMSDVFVAKHLNQKPTFFGCNSTDTATIIYVPNHNYTFPSGQPTSKLQYSMTESDGMIGNGVQIANYGGKANWPLCLACGIMKKSGERLPSGCGACFTEYCFN